MVTHKIKCPECQTEHEYESNITKPNYHQSSICGYTWETPVINCECGKEIHIQIKVNISIW
jgi:hypothetical protein